MKKNKIAIIGLGYVGLPLARLFATKFHVVGFDINNNRVQELKKGKDSTLEVEDDLLKAVLIDENSDKRGLYCSSTLSDIRSTSVFSGEARPVLLPVPNQANACASAGVTPSFFATFL